MIWSVRAAVVVSVGAEPPAQLEPVSAREPSIDHGHVPRILAKKNLALPSEFVYQTEMKGQTDAIIKARDLEHARLLADHADDEAARVVRGDGLALGDRHREARPRGGLDLDLAGAAGHIHHARAAVVGPTEAIRVLQVRSHHLAAEEGLGGDAGQQDLDHATGLLLHDSGQHQVAVDDDGRQQCDRHQGRRCVVVCVAAGRSLTSACSTGPWR